MNRKKIVLFGGTFDPVHLGHITVATESAKYIGADHFIFIPAKRSPLKGYMPIASDNDRLQMLQLAIENKDIFEISSYELGKPAPSYTLDTVRHFHNHYGKENDIFWLAGADSIEDLIYWHGITELIDECNLAMMYRAGCEKPDFSKYEALWGSSRIEKLNKFIIPTPLIDISSTKVRNRIKAGQDVSQLLDTKVLNFINKNVLYK